MQNEYHPDNVSCPGSTIKDTLDTLGISPQDMAKRLGIPLIDFLHLLYGEKKLTPNIAEQLERIVGIPSSFWLAREKYYRESKHD